LQSIVYSVGSGVVIMGFLDAIMPKKPRRGISKAVSMEMAEEWSGGDGIDREHAVVIHARDWRKGLADEYGYISSLHGLRSRDWFIESQEIQHHGTRKYEIFIIRTSDGARLRYYFDVTSFHG
jgi:hypothetical protein